MLVMNEFYSYIGNLSISTEGIFLSTALLGFIIFIVAFLVPLLVVLNLFGIRDHLFNTIGFLPGFRSRTAWKATLGIFVYLLLASIILLSISMMFLPPDNVEVRDSELSSQEVTAGDPIEVTGVVENVGNETESETVELAANGEAIEAREISLEPGEQQELKFIVKLSDSGEYDIELYGSVIGTVVVHDNIVFDEMTLSENEIGEGQSVEITGRVTNVGNNSDSRIVDLVVDGEVADSKEIVLDSGEEHEIQFTRNFEEAGDYDIEINGIHLGPLIVIELQPADFEITETSLSDNEIERGDSIEADITIRNVGDETGTYPLEITANGNVLEEKMITVEAGEEERITYNHRFMNPGEFDLAVNEKEVDVLIVSGLSDEVIFSSMEDSLLLYGVDVKDLERIGNEAYLTHSVEDPQPVEEYINILLVAGAYAGALDNGLPTDRLIVTMDATEIDEGVLEYRIESQWIQQLDEGEIDENELQSRIINSLEEAD